MEQTIIAEIESLKEKNASLWQVYGLGQQAIIDGLIFKNINVIDEVPHYIKRRYIGIDYGFTNDPTAIVMVAVDGDCLYIEELCYRTEMLTNDIIKFLKNGKYGDKKVISESADPRLVEEIYRAGVNIHPVKKYAGSVEAGVAKMLEHKIYITKDSTNAIKEFKNYTYAQDKEGKWLNTPIDLFNHCIDAIRYVVMEEIMGGERKGVDLSRLARRLGR